MMPIRNRIRVVLRVVFVGAWRIANVFIRFPFGPGCVTRYAKRVAEHDRREIAESEGRLAELGRSLAAMNARIAMLNEQSEAKGAEADRLRCEIDALRTVARGRVLRN